MLNDTVLGCKNNNAVSDPVGAWWQSITQQIVQASRMYTQSEPRDSF